MQVKEQRDWGDFCIRASWRNSTAKDFLISSANSAENAMKTVTNILGVLSIPLFLDIGLPQDNAGKRVQHICEVQ
jgi:hypothetical protein